MLNIQSCGRSLGLAAALVLAGVTAPAFAADGPTDPQIAHIAYTAGAIDVKAAQQALQISKNAEVRAFASDMVRDHTAVNDKALALVKKLNVTPEDNDTSKALTKEADERHAELAKLSARPMSMTRLPTTRPSTARFRLRSFRLRRTASSRACCRQVSKYLKAT